MTDEKARFSKPSIVASQFGPPLGIMHQEWRSSPTPRGTNSKITDDGRRSLTDSTPKQVSAILMFGAVDPDAAIRSLPLAGVDGALVMDTLSLPRASGGE